MDGEYGKAEGEVRAVRGEGTEEAILAAAGVLSAAGRSEEEESDGGTTEAAAARFIGRATALDGTFTGCCTVRAAAVAESGTV